MEAFDFSSRTWSLVDSLPVAIRGHSAVCLPDGIYVMGGVTNHHRYLSALYKMGPGKQWTKLASMDTPRAFFAAVANCAHIYVTGGCNGDNKDGLCLMERYDVMRNRWETLAPMARKRCMHSAAILNI